MFWPFNSDRGADLGSVWLVIQQASNHDFAAHTINPWSWLFFGAWCVGVLVLGLRAPETPRLAQLGFLVVAGFLLVNKVYSPQYVLWLLPLAVLARPRWRDQIVWQAGEVALLRAVWWYLGGYLDAGGGGDAGFYWMAILLRMAAELYLVADRGPATTGARPGTTRCATSGDDDAVERRRGVADPDVDLVADGGHRAPCGRNSIEACMCGGSAKSRCLPSIENGERTKPTASRPPRARVAARALSEASPVGASRPMPCAVPPLTTRRCPPLGRTAPR